MAANTTATVRCDSRSIAANSCSRWRIASASPSPAEDAVESLGFPALPDFPKPPGLAGVLAFLGVPAEPAGLAEDVIVAVEIMF